MRSAVLALVILTSVLIPGRADALPVFAHRFGLACQACHTTVPHLNAFGEAFARNGFRLPQLREHGAVPIAVKVNLAYSSDADGGGLPKAVVDEVELLTGGAIGAHASYFVEQYAVDGGRPGRPRDMWVQYNNADTHVRAGQFTLPLPVDPETERDTEAHYLLYEPLFAPRAGGDAYVEDARGNALHLAAFSGGTIAYAAKALGNLTLYGYDYRSSFSKRGFGMRARDGKFDVVEVDESGGGLTEAHYTFSPALMAVARYDRAWDSTDGAQRQTVLSLVMRPAANMRFTLEDQITDHHTLNLAWLFAY
ncbi:MAG TPA: hypothetical protein VIO32_11270 [Candidatus Baltobacteraceae bacterium]